MKEGINLIPALMVIIGGVGVIILIVILIVCLVKMKKRNDLIVAKVEKLTSVQLEKSDYIPDE